MWWWRRSVKIRSVIQTVPTHNLDLWKAEVTSSKVIILREIQIVTKVTHHLWKVDHIVDWIFFNLKIVSQCTAVDFKIWMNLKITDWLTSNIKNTKTNRWRNLILIIKIYFTRINHSTSKAIMDQSHSLLIQTLCKSMQLENPWNLIKLLLL